MSARNDVPPDTLGVELTEDGIAVEYVDDREVFYRGVPTAVEDSVRAAPGKDVHVLVTDASETQGIMLYVNDLNTHDDILESTGVGRVMVDDGDEEPLFQGVKARSESHRVEVEADLSVVDGRVFVFVEDEMGEQSFEIVENA
ncbi:DUF5796 family protein [Halosimplex pelagicum]|uniref:Uncharacterized protein n=1 Tax=Halosimplex pelagicum TaxID=869886 RepID=A0A7D5PAS2_9EURY|nr:DUF5796 family protein [Halosimplex pelagicum]QLH83581.1 hypothetical protein HZS54_18945 [Halosimplex pelagicum]